MAGFKLFEKSKKGVEVKGKGKEGSKRDAFMDKIQSKKVSAKKGKAKC